MSDEQTLDRLRAYLDNPHPTVEEAHDFLEEVPEKLEWMGTSCCPAWSMMAKTLFPQFKDNISMAIMHSAVAQEFEDLSRANYLRYTDANGMTREVRTITVNGILCIVDDNVPSTAGEAGAKTYDTYLFGTGSLRHASAPVTLPVETWRDPVKNGGVDFIGTRRRETIHPNGFTFKAPKAMGASPTNAELFNKANWDLAWSDPRAVFIGKMTTPGHAA